MHYTTLVKLLIIVTFVLYGIVYTPVLSAQEFSSEEINNSRARLDFFQGVSLLNQGNINESITGFRRAITVENLLVYQYMYAKANYSYGLVDARNSIFQYLIRNDFEKSFLNNKLELFSFRNNYKDSNFNFRDLVRTDSIDFSTFGFEVPVNIKVLPDGNLAIVFLKSHEVIIMTPLGKVVRELGTGVLPLAHPIDVLYTSSDEFLVSSFSNDTLFLFSKNGNYVRKFINETSIDDPLVRAQFSGPQYLAQDKDNNIYVTTYGSGRIFKFTATGDYIFDFGNSDASYRGLENPTGMEIIEETIYVADYYEMGSQKISTIYSFDRNGNFLKSMPVSSNKIETLRKIDASHILVAAQNSVLLFDIHNNVITEVFQQAEFSKVTSASIDKNKTLWITDIDRSRLESFAHLTTQYAGLEANIISVNTNNFPHIVVQYSVKNAFGTPVIGLDEDGVSIYENNITATLKRVIEMGKQAIDTNNIVLIPSIQSRNDANEVHSVIDAIRTITTTGENLHLNNVQSVNFWLLETLDIPYFTVQDTYLSREIMDTLESTVLDTRVEQNLYVTILFAVDNLLNTAGAKSIVYIGIPSAQSRIDIEQWNQLKNIFEYHGINFVWIQDVNSSAKVDIRSGMHILSNSLYSRTIDYLDITAMNSIFTNNLLGFYMLSYDSKITPQYENQFIPVTLEVNFFTKSAKDISGYVLYSE